MNTKADTQSFVFPEVRRRERLLDDAGQERLLNEGEYGLRLDVEHRTGKRRSAAG